MEKVKFFKKGAAWEPTPKPSSNPLPAATTTAQQSPQPSPSRHPYHPVTTETTKQQPPQPHNHHPSHQTSDPASRLSYNQTAGLGEGHSPTGFNLRSLLLLRDSVSFPPYKSPDKLRSVRLLGRQLRGPHRRTETELSIGRPTRERAQAKDEVFSAGGLVALADLKCCARRFAL